MKKLQPFELRFSGINLVESSAGTGKTYSITSLYIRALIEKEIDVDQILAVTYTEAATKELKDRILKRIRISLHVLKGNTAESTGERFYKELRNHVTDPKQAITRLEQALRKFDEASIYTIHGFCYRALQEQAFESGAIYDAELIGEDTELVQEAVDDYWRSWVAKVTDNPQQRPLLKMMTDENINPESLAGELGPYIAKPYMKILPAEIEEFSVGEYLEKLNELYGKIKTTWEEKREELFHLLDTGLLKRYTTKSLEKWFAEMDNFLREEAPSLKTFGNLSRFQQSEIDGSLKKKPREEGKDTPSHPFFKAIDEYTQTANHLQKFKIKFKKDLLLYLRQELIEKKEELEVLSYDDLLLRLRNALNDEERGKMLAEKLYAKYPIALVDEFQDTDPNQYAIFRSIYKSRNGTLFMIGDPKQSIYNFRGADVFSYLAARKDVPGTNRYSLDRNYRSTPKLLEGLNAFWGSHGKPFLVDEIAYRQLFGGDEQEEDKVFRIRGNEVPPIRFRRLTTENGDILRKDAAGELAALDTSKEIQRLLDSGRDGAVTIGEKGVAAKDIAVLVRTHKQAELIRDKLQDLGIKSVLHSKESVFESDEALQMEYLLKAVAEPSSDSRIKTALSQPYTGYTARRLQAIEEDSEQWSAILQRFSEWHEVWRKKGFAAMFRDIQQEWSIGKQLVGYTDGERRLTNFLHLGELLQEESGKHGKGGRSLIHWLARKRKENRSEGREEEQLRLESDEKLVKVVTMHKSKGLEYPIVFCPFLWYGPHYKDGGQPLEYHDPEDTTTVYLDLNGKSDPERAQKRFYEYREQQAESLRLAYVAMTRAQCALYISAGFANDTEYSSLGYLLQDPEQAEKLLKDKLKIGESADWTPEDMHHRVGELCESNPALFSLCEKPVDAGKQQLELLSGEEDRSLHRRSFTRATPLETSYTLSSFSSLSSWMKGDPDEPDYDQYLEMGTAEPVTGRPEKDLSMFTFPKGPDPGTCIHHIFEEIQFSQLANAGSVIEEYLSRYGIDAQWAPAVERMIRTVVDKPIGREGVEFSLSGLQTGAAITEMEFHYRTGGIKTTEMLSILRDGEGSGDQGMAARGFLKGFIDLTFRVDNRYYILDYKTNYLGDTKADYRADKLEREMREASYDLQYHIYTIALHRHLLKRMPGYSYKEHFGGVYYLFLRGMNKAGEEGIYFDRPDESVIHKLNEYIGT